MRRLGQQPEHAEERHRLARAALADDADHLAWRDIEVDAADGLDLPVRCPERTREVPQREQDRAGRSAPVSSFGSTASRRPSPMKLMQIASSTNAPQGNDHEPPVALPGAAPVTARQLPSDVDVARAAARDRRTTASTRRRWRRSPRASARPGSGRSSSAAGATSRCAGC